MKAIFNPQNLEKIQSKEWLLRKQK